MRKLRPSPPPAPEPDDADLFRAAIGPVRELVPPPEPPRAPKPKPLPRQRDLDEARALEDSRLHPFDYADGFGDRVEYLREGVAPKVLKRLKRGDYAVQDEFDLHGMNAVLAERVLREFLHDSRRADNHCVRIVHGKGRNSEGDFPVLKALAERMLRQRSDVLAFASAPAAQGGTGAVLVLLARRRPNEAAGAEPLT